MKNDGKGKKSATRRQTKEESSLILRQAGFQFPVGRTGRYLKKGRYAPRISSCTAIYLVAEVLELVGNVDQDIKKNWIIPRHVLLAVRIDEDLEKLLAGVNMAHGPVLPNINPVLLPKKSIISKEPKSPSKKATKSPSKVSKSYMKA